MISRWSIKPFEVVGRSAALNERETIGVFRRLREIGVISRIGAVVRPNTIGASTLAAMQVPPERLEEVAAIVSREPLVTHNYERTHALNLWFVIAGADANAIAATIESIRQQTGLAAIDLPMLQAYHLDLGFPLGTVRPVEAGGRRVRRGLTIPDPRDRRILAAIEDGLPLVEQPYRAVAEQLDSRSGRNHRAARPSCRLPASSRASAASCAIDSSATTANAMAVWDVPDDMVDVRRRPVSRAIRTSPCATAGRGICRYWPYNHVLHGPRQGAARRLRGDRRTQSAAPIPA